VTLRIYVQRIAKFCAKYQQYYAFFKLRLRPPVLLSFVAKFDPDPNRTVPETYVLPARTRSLARTGTYYCCSKFKKWPVITMMLGWYRTQYVRTCTVDHTTERYLRILSTGNVPCYGTRALNDALFVLFFQDTRTSWHDVFWLCLPVGFWLSASHK